jgi:hypothetical protein
VKTRKKVTDRANYIDFIFEKFQDDKIAADEGLRLLIEAICRALVLASAREDLDGNIKKAMDAIRCATPLYYESIKDLLESEDI